MKIAIPIFGNRVSPRFDFSPEMWIIEVEKGVVLREAKFSTVNLNSLQRLDQITSNGVDKVICGGIDDFSRNQLGRKGIAVVQDIIGDADIVFDLFMKGRLRTGLCYERKRRKDSCAWKRESGGIGKGV